MSGADSRRYEMEDLIASLQEQLQAQARPVSPSTMARQATTAIEIDNESLREQVQHLQKKLGTLEDLLEDARAATEREETAGRERLMQYKESEDAVRQELLESQKEIERVVKSEESARARVAEIEEALRENTVALENARAEIEGLRAEIAVSANQRRKTDAADRIYVTFCRIWRALPPRPVLSSLRNVYHAR